MKKILLWGVVIIILLGIGAVFYWKSSLGAPDPSDKSFQEFVVEKGAAARDISDKLAKEGFVKNAFTFYLLLRQQGGGYSIEAGDYKLSRSMDAQQVLDTLHHGTLDVWITLPDGERADEYASIMQKNLKSYTDAWKPVLEQNEGYLYPDSYLIPSDATVDTVVSILTKNFYSRVSDLNLTPSTPGLNRDIIIASLLEREGKTLQDKKLIASVIYNRLAAGMPLQIDAAVQYGLGYDTAEKTWWKQDLTTDDLAVRNPYNLYLVTGLPPTPICNPGHDAIEAAVNPATSSYLYYVSDKQGNLHFAKTLAEHEKNVARYIGK